VSIGEARGGWVGGEDLLKVTRLAFTFSPSSVDATAAFCAVGWADKLQLLADLESFFVPARLLGGSGNATSALAADETDALESRGASRFAVERGSAAGGVLLGRIMDKQIPDGSGWAEATATTTCSRGPFTVTDAFISDGSSSQTAAKRRTVLAREPLGVQFRI